MVAEGAKVVLTDINADLGRQVAADIGGDALFVSHDVSSEDQWIAAIDETLNTFGRLDVVVNSAGIGNMGNVEETTLDDWHRMMAINLDGVFLGCKHGVKTIKQHGDGGSIVNLSSVSGIIGGHNMAAYNASKGGVRLLTKSVALHCARQGYNIRCNSVHPTFIDTPMVQGMITRSSNPEKTRGSLERQVPLGRLGVPNDVGYMVLYLASDESAFVTGAEMVVDGGIVAQ
jgi:NAD(P)-dependent dehydrogenase (short-subunit alcohol dehydrogenase family)